MQQNIFYHFFKNQKIMFDLKSVFYFLKKHFKIFFSSKTKIVRNCLAEL